MTSGFSEPFHGSPSNEASHRYLSRRNLSASAAFGSVLKGGSYANSDHVGRRWWYIVPHGWCIGSATYRATQCDGAENRLVLWTKLSTAPLLGEPAGRTARGVAGEPLISSPLLLRQPILSRLLKLVLGRGCCPPHLYQPSRCRPARRRNQSVPIRQVAAVCGRYPRSGVRQPPPWQS